MQNDFCHPDGYFARRESALISIGLEPWLIRIVIPRVKELLQAARAAGLFVAFTRVVRSADSFNNANAIHRILPETYAAYLETGESSTLPPDTWGASIVDELAPIEGEYVVTKRGFSAFFNTDLESVLRRRGIRTVILAGTVTYVCVLHTAFDAYVRDFDVVAASDATASWEPTLQGPAMRIIDLILGTCAPVDDLIRAIQPSTMSFGSTTGAGAVGPSSRRLQDSSR